MLAVRLNTQKMLSSSIETLNIYGTTKSNTSDVFVKENTYVTDKSVWDNEW